MIKIYSTLAFLVLMLCSVLAADIASSPQGHHFLIEAKVVIDGKTFTPMNISVTIGSKITIPQYSFNLSSVNYNKNVTIPLRLFVWYNAQWTLSRQTLLLKITDKRNVLPLQNHLLAVLLKYNSRRYQSRMIDEKQTVILNSTSVIISYDPESSLFVSRLQDPAIFNHQNSYLPFNSFTSDMKSKPMKITINFDVLTRSDLFINVKNHIVSLNELSSKIKQRIPLLFRHPQPELIEPKQLWRLFIQNYEAIKKSHKQFSEKTSLMANKKYESLLSPRLHQVPSLLTNFIKLQLSALNITVSDTFIPTYYFVLHQGFILDTINQLQNYLRQNVNDQLDRDYLELFQQWANKDILASFIIATLWVILDVFSYKKYSCFQGLSYSFGYFLVTWLFVEIFALSIRIGQTLNAYWALGFVFVSLILFKFIINYVQNRFYRSKHKHYLFDRKITQYVFNLIFLGVLANGILHLFVEKDIQSGVIILWSLAQFQMLLKEYYYFLVMIPPLLLSLKLKSGQPIGWLRLLILLLIGLKDNYWLIIDHSHWTLIVLRLKEQILFILLFLVKITLGNKPIEVINEQEQLQEKKQEKKQGENKEQKKEQQQRELNDQGQSRWGNKE